MVSEIAEMIFFDIFKLEAGTVASAGYSLPNQIINLLIIPHIVLFIFLFSATKFVARTISSGIQKLLMLGLYLFIVINGWYAAFASLSQFWMFLLLGASAVFFFIGGRIAKPSDVERLSGWAGKVSNKVSDVGGFKERQLAKQEFEDLKKIINDERIALNNARQAGRLDVAAQIQSNIDKYMIRYTELQRKYGFK